MAGHRSDIPRPHQGTRRMGNADGSAGLMGTRSRAGVHDSFCSPAAVSRYPGAVVAGSARTRSTRADPAISGVNSSPSCFRYASSVWPPRAAYARTPRLPTSPNGVILGITAVTVMSSPARRDSSWAYPAMNRWVALDPAYPPLAGDPLMAAPLLTTTTLLPGGSGFSSASRSQVNAILTSVCQLTENVSHVWYWSGRITGLAPATRIRTSGPYWSSRLHATVPSAASATSVRMFALVVASSARAGPVRATATTGTPAAANARAIPRPKPRLAPTTTVVLPDKSLMFVLFFCVSMGSLALVLVVAADPELEPLALVAALRRAVQDRVVTHQELHTTRAGGIGVVDSPVVQGEDAEALGLGQVMDYVRACLPRIAGGDRRQLFEHRHDPLARLLLAARETECEVER